MLFQVIILIAVTSNEVMASPDPLTREEGENVIFMFNVSTSILEVTWGIRDVDTNDLKLGLIAVKNISGKIRVTLNHNDDYAGRVSYVGDLSKDQAWFKIKNLNINDTNQYMVKMILQGEPKGQYNYMFTKLFVKQKVFTTEQPTTHLTSSSTLTQDPTHFRSTIPPTSSPSTVSSPRPPGARTGVHPGIIAGVVVVGVLAIAGLVITIIFVCRKKASKKDYRSSTGPGQRYEMEARHGEPEEQYASVQRPNASGAKQSPENDQPLTQYAAVDKSKKTKKKTKEPGELIYAQLDHDHNASMGARPPSDRHSTGETGDTVYADIQGDKKKQRYPPPQYGNIHDMSYA